MIVAQAAAICGTSDAGVASTLRTLLAATVGTVQLYGVSQLSGQLKKSETVTKEHDIAIKVLVNLFYNCPGKLQLKRAIASCLQGSNKAFHTTCMKYLQTELDQALADEYKKPTIGTLAALLEHFNLGEECVKKRLIQVIDYLSLALFCFREKTGMADSPVKQNELMQCCLATVQATNKLFNKYLQKLQEDIKSSVLKDILVSSLNRLLSVIKSILTKDTFLLDCQVNCGIILVLLVKLFYPDTAVKMLCYSVLGCIVDKNEIKKDELKLPHPILKLSELPLAPSLCLYNGMVAVLGTDDLISTVSSSGKVFMVDVLGQNILNLSKRVPDCSSKLILARLMYTWTAKACQCLESQPSNKKLCGILNGKSEVPQKILQYVWTHWEDPTDAIRYQTRSVFDNFIKMHLLASKEEPSKSVLLKDLATSLLRVSWHSKGKFGPLCTLVGYLGAAGVLQLRPNMPAEILEAAGDQTLSNQASELYEKLLHQHKTDVGLSTSKSKDADLIKLWQKTWVDPVLEVLCKCGRAPKARIIEYIVPCLLKNGGQDCIPYISNKLSTQSKEMTVNELGALMTCLKRARSLGYIQQRVNGLDSWNDILPVIILRRALCHQDDQIRLDSLGLICESNKSTEIASDLDLDLIKFFLPLNLQCQSSSFRQQMISLIKKLLTRIKEGGKYLKKHIKNSSKKQSIPVDVYKANLKSYKAFLSWLSEELYSHLHPQASLPSRSTVLSMFTVINLVFSETSGSELYKISDHVTSAHVQTLLDCLMDNHEDNKSLALDILLSLRTLPGLETPGELKQLLQTTFRLVATTKPPDCTTAAYILRLLVKQSALLPALREGGAASTDENTLELRMLLTIEKLLALLVEQLSVARKSLLHAAATRPLYPVLHTVRYLYSDINLRDVKLISQWKQILETTITVCFDVATVVSPIISHSSPEGNVPIDSFIGPGLTLESVLHSDTDCELMKGAEESVKTVQMMPAYLVVCCWRSIKEVSLLLGLITNSTPIVDDDVEEEEEDDGLISCHQIKSIGEYFTTQLLESRHRGAYELAYTGFVCLCNMLWNCPISELQPLPRKWLEEILSDINQSALSTSRLCPTRRSAGVPFYIQALVSTEPKTTGRNGFKQVMSDLLDLSLLQDSKTEADCTPQVHSLNVLRALYRDTRLGEDVFPYVSDGVRASIQGFSSKFWSVRNSSTLLFSTLMVRIFGVKRSKDDASRKNCLNGRVFFDRFPSLFPFLLEQLEIATKHIGSKELYQLHPSLYPVLMILGRLLPSILEGTDSSLNIAAFIPHVIKCSGSAVYKTRIMAARALHPLVSKDQLPNVFVQLASQLPTETGVPKISQNKIHGILLQISSLLADVSAMTVTMTTELVDPFLAHIHSSLWIMTSKNECYVTRTAFIDTTYKLLQLDWPEDNEEVDHYLCDLQMALADDIQKVVYGNRAVTPVPGIVDFHLMIADVALKTSFSTQSEDGISSLTYKEVIAGLLTSQHYEVRLLALKYILAVLSSSNHIDLDKAPAIEPDADSCNSLETDASNDLSPDHEFPISQTSDVEVVTEIRKSGLLLSRLVAMAMATEKHPECLAEVLNVLSNHPLATVFPWEVTGTSYTTTNVMKWCLSLIKSHIREEVRCAAFKLSGVLVAQLYGQMDAGCSTSSVRDLFRAWIEVLKDSCLPEQSIETRMILAEVMLYNAENLLLDPQSKLGWLSFHAWTVLVRLLQDDDDLVRNIASNIIVKIWKARFPGRVMTSIISTLALDLAVGILVDVNQERDWDGCRHFLQKWIYNRDEDPYKVLEEHTEKIQEGLFEKGDRNTYEDVVSFSRLVCRHMIEAFKLSGQLPTGHRRPRWLSPLYQSLEDPFWPSIASSKPTNNQPGNGTVSMVTGANNSDDETVTLVQPGFPAVSNYQKVVHGLFRELSGTLRDKATTLPVIHHSGRFLEASNYQTVTIYVYGAVLILWAYFQALKQTNLDCQESAANFKSILQQFVEKFSQPSILVDSVSELE